MNLRSDAKSLGHITSALIANCVTIDKSFPSGKNFYMLSVLCMLPVTLCLQRVSNSQLHLVLNKLFPVTMPCYINDTYHLYCDSKMMIIVVRRSITMNIINEMKSEGIQNI